MAMKSIQRHRLTGKGLPSVATEPPGPESRRLAEALSRYESPAISTISAGQVPIFWAEAKGANVVDADGNTYIDMTSAFGVASVGHAHPKVVRAMGRQAQRLVHGMGDIYPHPLRAELARRLAEIAPGRLEKCLFGSTGAEAVELALKTAARFTGKPGVIAFHGAFHGQSFGALGATARRYFRDPFISQIPGNVVHAPYPYCYRCPWGEDCPSCVRACLHYVEHLLDNPSSGVPPIGAILVEPVQGRDGEIVPPPEFLPGLESIARKRGLLLIVDEIMTGLGRTGRMFAVEHWGVQPDIMCLGKALGGGFPISICTGTAEVMDAWSYASGEPPHSSTFMANPMGCAAALATLEVIEEESLIARSQRLGDYLKAGLLKLERRFPIIGEVRGLGMMAGMELVKDRSTKEPATEETRRVIREALRHGVILLAGGTYGNVISLEPPLVITRRQLDYAIDILQGCLRGIY